MILGLYDFSTLASLLGTGGGSVNMVEVYTTPPGSQNLVYQQLAPFVLASQAFPNQGFPEARLRLNPALEEALGGGEARAVASSGGKSGLGVELLYAPARESRSLTRERVPVP